jgi:hypothetical protein
MKPQLAAENIRMTCIHKARRAAGWVLQRTEATDLEVDESVEVAEPEEDLDLDARFDTYLDLVMEEDSSRAWFTA